MQTTSQRSHSLLEPQSLWGCSSHCIPSTQNCLKPLRSKTLPDLDNRYFEKLIDVVSIDFVSVRNKVVGSRELTRPWWVVSYHAVFPSSPLPRATPEDCRQQHAARPASPPPGFSPRPSLSPFQSALSSSGSSVSAARAESETLLVPEKSSVDKGVFHSRVERVKEVRPFWGVTLNQTC